MNNKKSLCEQIRAIYPEVGECGIDVKTEFDQKTGAWAVDLKQGAKNLRTYLEKKDTQACLEGRQCVNLSTQIGQLVSNIKSL